MQIAFYLVVKPNAIYRPEHVFGPTEAIERNILWIKISTLKRISEQGDPILGSTFTR